MTVADEAPRVITLDYKPRPQQLVVHRALARHRFVVLVTHRRFGKCLDVDTPIATPAGYVSLGDVMAGDEVFGPDGCPTRVVAAHDVLLGRPCFRVEFSDGAEAICDGEHLWQTQTKLERTARDCSAAGRAAGGVPHGVKRERVGTVRTTEEIAATLRYQGETNHAVATCAPLQYASVALPVDPYLLGCWVGDGTSPSAQITTADEEVRAAFAAVYDTVPAQWQSSGRATTYLVRGLGMPLRALGVLGRKHLPEAYLRASVAQRVALLQGLMDTDGCINTGTGICEFTQKRAAVVHGMCDLLSSLGVKYRLRTREIAGVAYFRVMFTPPLQPFRLPRKAARWAAREDHSRYRAKRYIVSVEPVDSRPVRCLEVAHESHLFLCSRWNIPTHNTVLAVNHLIKGALTCTKQRPRFGFIAPTYTQGKSTAFDYCRHYSQPVPDTRVNQSELRIDFPNDSQVRIYGADNPDNLRGLYFDGVVLDEYGMHQSKTFSEVIGPTLVDRGGTALFLGTPNGKNQFFEIAQHAKAEQAKGNQDWFFAEYRASQTGLLDAAYLEAAKAVMTSDEYAQEFEASFEASVKGAIYAKELEAARVEGRITAVPMDPTLKVDTDWDLGIGDAMSVWFSQTVKGSGQVRLIDYYEASGEGFPHFVRVLSEKRYTYGTHWAPHDIAVRELGSGKSRLEVAAGLGLRFSVTPRLSSSAGNELEDGIHAVRLFLPRCWFDATKCRAGLEALGQYRRDYNARLDEFKATPVHDAASHAADSFRGLSVRHQIPKETPDYGGRPRGGADSWMT